MIKERRESDKAEERYDLFSSLLDASEAEADATLKLTDTELMGTAHEDFSTLLSNSIGEQAIFTFS